MRQLSLSLPRTLDLLVNLRNLLLIRCDGRCNPGKLIRITWLVGGRSNLGWLRLVMRV